MSKGNYERLTGEQIKDRRRIFMDLAASTLDTKIAYTHRIIERAIADGQKATVLFSGGKDSTVLLHLVRMHRPGVQVMHNNTTLGAPETISWIRDFTKGMNYYETTAPDPWRLWQKTGYFPICAKRTFLRFKHAIPGLQIQPIACCYNLKAIPANRIMSRFNTQVAFWGNRAGESNRRLLHFLDHGFLFKPQQSRWWQCYPIQHWSDADIETYLAQHVPEFDKGRHFESGCLVCMTDIGKFPNNASRLFDSNRELWEKTMRAGFGEQILRLQGVANPTPATLEEILKLSPKALLKIGGKTHG